MAFIGLGYWLRVADMTENDIRVRRRCVVMCQMANHSRSHHHTITVNVRTCISRIRFTRQRPFC